MRVKVTKTTRHGEEDKTDRMTGLEKLTNGRGRENGEGTYFQRRYFG